MITLMRNKGSFLSVGEMDDNIHQLDVNRIKLDADAIINGLKTFTTSPRGVDVTIDDANQHQAFPISLLSSVKTGTTVVSLEKPINPDPSDMKTWLTIDNIGNIVKVYFRDPDNINNWKLDVLRNVVPYETGICLVLSNGDSYISGQGFCGLDMFGPLVNLESYSNYLLPVKYVKSIQSTYGGVIITTEDNKCYVVGDFVFDTYPTMTLLPNVKNIEILNVGTFEISIDGKHYALYKTTYQDNSVEFYSADVLLDTTSVEIFHSDNYGTFFKTSLGQLHAAGPIAANLGINSSSNGFGNGAVISDFPITSVKNIIFTNYGTVIVDIENNAYGTGYSQYMALDDGNNIIRTFKKYPISNIKKALTTGSGFLFLLENGDLYCGGGQYAYIMPNLPSSTTNLVRTLTGVQDLIYGISYRAATLVLFVNGDLRGYGYQHLFALPGTIGADVTVDGVLIDSGIKEITHWYPQYSLIYVNASDYFRGFSNGTILGIFGNTIQTSVLKRTDIYKMFSPSLYIDNSGEVFLVGQVAGEGVILVNGLYEGYIHTGIIDFDFNGFVGGSEYIYKNNAGMLFYHNGNVWERILEGYEILSDHFKNVDYIFVVKRNGEFFGVTQPNGVLLLTNLKTLSPVILD